MQAPYPESSGEISKSDLHYLAKKRRRWEREFSHTKSKQLRWHTGDVPETLQSFFEKYDPPKGLAVDLGCGISPSTAFIAEKGFMPAVGLDIALSAVVKAQKMSGELSVTPDYVVAAAPFLPFKSEQAGFLYDRGCMHALPSTLWQPYLSAVSRILKPGGYFQLWTKALPGLNLEKTPISNLEIMDFEAFDFDLKDGRQRQIHHVIYRKKLSAATEVAGESAPAERVFIEALAHPKTGEPLELADDHFLESVNRDIETGKLQNAAGNLLKQPLTAALITQSKGALFPVKHGAPILLIDEEITIE